MSIEVSPGTEANTPRPRLFVTGGAGFIGCRVVQQAARLGFPVTATTALNNDAERRRMNALADAGIPVIVATLNDHRTLQSALRDHDIVIHLAAAQHEAHAPENHFHAVNVQGTRTLLELAAANGVQRFVYGSTIGVYGGASATMLDEASPLLPENSYGRTKAEAERVVLAFSGLLEVSIARISETYGPGDMRLLKLFRAIKQRRYVTLGSGRNAHQLIYVDDLAMALLAAATLRPAAGHTFILARDEILTTNDMVAAIAATVGCTDPPRHVPLWPFEIAAAFFERTFAPFGLHPPIYPRRLDFFRKSFRLSTRKAATLLGFRAATSFQQGAEMTAHWYREQGLL